MNIELTWLSHGSWAMNIGETNVLLDPFLDENPAASCKAADLAADFILVSHGHFDHVADVAGIANRTGATVVAIFEIAEWFANKHGVENTIGMNLGGGVDLLGDGAERFDIEFGQFGLDIGHGLELVE